MERKKKSDYWKVGLCGQKKKGEQWIEKSMEALV
jgi:hypothetical protein